MSRAKQVNAFVCHTTGGTGGVRVNEDWWRTPRVQGGPGWTQTKGYNVMIERDGKMWFLKDPKARYGYTDVYDPKCWEHITNGVGGFNRNIVNVSYIGGVGGKDDRTEAQKASFLIAIRLWIEWMQANGGDLSKAQINGHYKYSKDINGNGIIDPWEKSKTCPNFDAWAEYRWILQTAGNPANRLPNP